MNINLIGLNRNTRTAGPGTRLEYFTKGCIRGVVNPCAGCFNQETWTFEGDKRGMTTEELAEHALSFAYNGLITFCGGEPMLQAKAITDVARRVKEQNQDAHIIMYTAYNFESLMKHGLKFTWIREQHGDAMYNALVEYSSSFKVIEHDDEADFSAWAKRVEFQILTEEDVRQLMLHVDVIVDGDYQADKRLTKAKHMHEGWFIGSANQRVINSTETLLSGELDYLTAEEFNKLMIQIPTCKDCGSPMPYDNQGYCSATCSNLHKCYVEGIEMGAPVQ